MPPRRTTESRTQAVLVVVAALIIGAAVRVELLRFAPRYAFHGDHVDYVCWGRQAVARGVLDLYRNPPSACPSLVYLDHAPVPTPLMSGTGERLNYPPLAAYIFWAQGQLLAALDPSQTANTFTSRAVYAISTTLAETVTAAGAAAIVGIFAGPLAAASAFAITLLAPTLLTDGPFWGQTESWILAPAVWMLWAMIRERWLLAGALWGVALALKPSGLIFGPLWAYAFLFRRRTAVMLAGIAAAAVVNVIALPFWLSSGAAWLRAAYLENYVYKFHWSTMLTFNVWYIDLLLTEHNDSQALLLGLTRDTWGTLLLLIGLVAAFALAHRWERRHPARAHLGLVPLAALMTLAAVSLPTRVHCTYTTFTTPFLICAAFLVPAMWPGAAVMLLAATLQMLSWQWGNLLAVHVLENEQSLPPARYAERRALRARDRPREWALTLVSLGATAAVFTAVATGRRRPDAPDDDARHPDVAAGEPAIENPGR